MEFKYKELLDSMDQSTFGYCRDKLWDLFDYRVLTKEDVRKIDMEDQILRIQGKYPLAFGTKNPDYVLYYLDSLRFCFERYLKCPKGSREELYYNRAIGMIDEIKKDKVQEKIQWDSLITIFISLMRWKAEKGNTSFQLTVKKEDADLFNKYRINDKYGLKIWNALHQEKNFVYMVTILYISSVLNTTGGLTEEE